MLDDGLPPGPTHLQIEPTSRCNFTCAFCAGRHMPQGDLTLAHFKQVIDALPTLRYLHLQGEGEPLLNHDFFGMARYARERGLVLSLITNGSLLNSAAIEQLLDLEFAWIAVSLETLDPGRFREIRGGSLEKVLANTANLVVARERRGRQAPVVNFAVTVMADTVDQADHIAALSRDLGLAPPSFQPLESKHDYTRFYTQDLLDRIPSAALLASISDVRDERSIWQEIYGFHSYFDALWSGWQGPQCAFVGRSLYVEHTGDVTPCCMIKDHNSPRVGNILRESADQIWRSPVRRSINLALQDGTVPACCKGCVVTAKMTRDENLSISSAPMGEF